MNLKIGAVFVIALGAALTITEFAANAAGAIAIGRCDRYGWSRNYANTGGARRRAMRECESDGSNCQVVVTLGHGSCGAFAVSGRCGARGWAYAGTSSRARRLAIDACRDYGGNRCRVRVSFCDNY